MISAAGTTRLESVSGVSGRSRDQRAHPHADIGNVFALWLKQNPNHKYSVYEINNIPTVVPGANIFAVRLEQTCSTTGDRR